MNTSTAELFGSSHYRAIADDALKDEDNAAWVMELDPDVRQAWIERIRWIRLADRLAENELIEERSGQFQAFCNSWRWLSATGTVQPTGDHRSLFESMRDCWFDQADPSSQFSRQAWQQYLTALNRYSQKNLVFDTIAEFETMLRELAASFFQVLPFLSDQTCQVVGAFGVVDQFYNTLRDLREDAEQGICYLPNELLDRFAVTRSEILDLRAYDNPGFRSMMQFWIYDYLPTLQRRTYPFLLSSDLHPSWQILRDWSLNRYRRIERVMRHCDYDYVRFPQVYWREVQRDLVLLMPARWGNATAPKQSSKAVSFHDRHCKLRKFVATDLSQCG
ncbi:squalene/phytoene synthase family protein [Cyanobacteria bacterium FACHB-DQ100]|uniref:squalene/phytoene synthase family protein n=1 Tax=unclassified Leptolyngbya TaxID=2650499 RepID=UPI00168016B3|nr:squalene/phytoene synthase family protein [Leptolyngbya sp. FACHB-17]MBD1822257.1 squalene/phytoene synthase family protein [Cyanobacteria bacterium FACHB-DQ100]MBD2081237.1 squalene/phytoene synthase family protein [Leptolyngbya sp. FACHB-17]